MRTTREEREETVSIPFEEFVHKTDAAFLLKVDGEDIWFPRSQIENEEDILDGEDVDCVDIPRWLAEEKGLE